MDALVIALSGRALAASAARAGYRVGVLDLFEDVDTVRLAAATARASGTLRSGFRAAALLAAAERLAPAGVPLVYGSGFDRRPRLLGRLAGERPLLGNPPAAVRAMKSPAAFFGLLDRLGIPAPPTTPAPPADPRGWLAKRVGGAGGAHIRPAAGAAPGRDVYYQRRVDGRPVSALFLADGRRAVVLAFSAQWPSPDGRGGDYRYGGAAFPEILPDGLRLAIERAIGRLVAETGLVGANSADMLVDGDGFVLLEVNPRPGASLEAFDLAFGASLFELHVDACRGRLPKAPPAARCGAAGVIVYADRRLTAPPPSFWPDWAADIPRAGQTFRPGEPVCTATATADDAMSARCIAETRLNDLLAELRQYGYGSPAAMDAARDAAAASEGMAGG